MSFFFLQHLLASVNLLQHLYFIVFVIFTISFTLFYQNDVWALGLWHFGGNSIIYSDWIAVLIVIFSTTLLYRIVHVRICKLYPQLHLLSFLPSFLVLILLSELSLGAHINIEQMIEWCSWGIIFFLLICVYKYTIQHNIQLEENKWNGRTIWTNLLFMASFMFLTCMLSSVKDTEMYRLRIERYILKGEFEKALQVGKKSLSNDSTLFALRVLVLQKKGILAEKIFEYPVISSSKAMNIDGKRIKTWMIPQEYIENNMHYENSFFVKNLNNQATSLTNQPKFTTEIDRELCALLLDKNINAFVRKLKKYYDISIRLPKHYKEALILYKHLTSNPYINYTHDILDADYDDFQKLKITNSDPVVRKNKLCDVYGNTYWYYYFYS